MRNLHELDKFRLEMSPHLLRAMNVVGNPDLSRNGVFRIIHHNSHELHVIAAVGGGWDHVSVSLEDRCPTWEEMSLIHRMFFKPDEVAIQFHVPLEDHININPYVLHLWRCRYKKIPLPPKSYV